MTSFDDREARLIPTLINVLIAGMSDQSRLSRGRTYFRQGAVMDLEIDPGVLSGAVQGNRREPYDVTIHVNAAKQFDNLSALVPTAKDVSFACSCPDWESPCKHAVAVMAAFSKLVSLDPGLLVTWRGVATDAPTVRATIGSRANHSPSPPAAMVILSDEARDALQAFVDGPLDFPIPEFIALAPPRADAWDDPWVTMLDDALTNLRSSPRQR